MTRRSPRENGRMSADEFCSELRKSKVSIAGVASSLSMSSWGVSLWKRRGVPASRVDDVMKVLSSSELKFSHPGISPSASVLRLGEADSPMSADEFCSMMAESGLSRAQVAEGLGLSLATVSKYKRDGVYSRRARAVREFFAQDETSIDR